MDSSVSESAGRRALFRVTAYGCLFTLIVLAGAICVLHTIFVTAMGRPDPPISNHGLPHDAEYADDVDLNDEVNLKRILPVATDVLKRWNLFVNADKTDYVFSEALVVSVLYLTGEWSYNSSCLAAPKAMS